MSHLTSTLSGLITSTSPLSLLNPFKALALLLQVSYILFQAFIIVPIFAPTPKSSKSQKKNGRKSKKHSGESGKIAIIGAGLTGVSSAAHCIAHGFTPTIFEANPGPDGDSGPASETNKSNGVGGIWRHVNTTSALQLNSLCYRFHPFVLWREGFPDRDEILAEIEGVWKAYGLQERTRFDVEVTSVKRQRLGEDGKKGKWVVNGDESEVYDAVIVTVGTCGKPKWIAMDGMPNKALIQKIKGASDSDSESKSKDEEDEKDEDKEEETPSDLTLPKENTSYADALKVDPSSPSSSSTSLSDDESHEPSSYADAIKTNPDDLEHQKVSPDDSAPAPSSYADAIKTSPEDIEHTHRPPTPDVQPSAVLEEKAASAAKLKDEEFPDELLGDDEEHEHEQEQEQERGVFNGPIVHSSQLDGKDVSAESIKGKNVIVLGSGASGVEAAETALKRGAGRVWMVARSDKWIIPRNIFISTLIACQPFGREMPLSFLWERFLKWTHYRGAEGMVPDKAHGGKGLFEGTPIVNDEFLPHVRDGKIVYVRGSIERLSERGVVVDVRSVVGGKKKNGWFNFNSKGEKGKGGEEEKKGETEFAADLIVLATGFEKPSVDFLEEGLFPEGYERPDLYLQNFSTEDWSILMTNSSYVNAIGTVGHFHIGIYTRILITLLLDPSARPEPKDMKLWVDVVRFIKRGAKGGALGFFTYAELTFWLIGFLVLRPDRMRWLFFIMFGWGVKGPSAQ